MKDEATPEQLAMARRIAANECAAASWKRAIALGEMDDWHGVKIALAAIIETQRLDAEFVEKFGPSDDIGNYETATALRAAEHYSRPERLWLHQRVVAERRYGSWRRFPLYRMSGPGEDAEIVEGIAHPTPEMFRIAQDFAEDQQ